MVEWPRSVWSFPTLLSRSETCPSELRCDWPSFRFVIDPLEGEVMQVAERALPAGNIT